MSAPNAFLVRLSCAAVKLRRRSQWLTFEGLRYPLRHHPSACIVTVLSPATCGHLVSAMKCGADVLILSEAEAGKSEHELRELFSARFLRGRLTPMVSDKSKPLDTHYQGAPWLH